MAPSPSPTGIKREGSVDHSPPGQHHAQRLRSERSRNAMAQARHRAKRKAYIEQLELTVTKLQSILDLSADQVDSIPSPLARMRELEKENDLLLREVVDLRRQLAVKEPQPELDSRDTYPPLPSDSQFDHEANHRIKANAGQGDVTSSPYNHSPPRPLSMPCITGQFSSYGFRVAANSPHPSQLLGSNYSYGVPATSHLLQTGTSSAMSNPMVPRSDHPPSSLSSYSLIGSPLPSHGDSALPPFSHISSQFPPAKLDNRSMDYTYQNYS